MNFIVFIGISVSLLSSSAYAGNVKGLEDLKIFFEIGAQPTQEALMGKHVLRCYDSKEPETMKGGFLMGKMVAINGVESFRLWSFMAPNPEHFDGEEIQNKYYDMAEQWIDRVGAPEFWEDRLTFILAAQERDRAFHVYVRQFMGSVIIWSKAMTTDYNLACYFKGE